MKNAPTEIPQLPLTPAVMDRAELLVAAFKAASAAALGQDDAQSQRQLDGTKFEFRIRFGCPQANDADNPALAPFNVRFNAEDRTLRIRAAPEIAMEGAAQIHGGDQAIEAVEGFWVRKPWLLNAGCVIDPRMGATEASEDEGVGAPDEAGNGVREEVVTADRGFSVPVVGIAQFFTKSDSRTIRRNGRAYEITKVLKDDEEPSADGYNLVLAGRLRSSQEGRVINCKPRGWELPPECLISVELDRVWVEDPAGKGLLAEWS